MAEPASVAHLLIRIGSGTGRIKSGTSRWLLLPARKKPNKVPAEYDTITSFRGHLDDVSFSHWILIFPVSNCLLGVSTLLYIHNLPSMWMEKVHFIHMKKGNEQ
jgi:hypothetical protein